MKKNLFKGITFILLICSAQIQAQEYLGVKIGGFFEQLYGGETDEEAIDICGTQDDYLFGGWTDVTVEEATSKDATYWYTNRFGKQNYVKYLGSHETDEVTTGIVSVTPEYFAICVHESGNWEQDEVKTGDRLWVYYIDVATGTVQWSDFLSYEEGGAAPTDIQYDGSGNLYVLLNRLTSTGAIQTEVLNYDLLGNKLWTSQPYLNSTLGHWSSELVVNSTGLTTFPYDLSAKNPGAITYNFSGVIINGTSFTADGESRIYGIYEDTVNGDIYGAGYVIGENSDTNAYVLKTNSSLVQQSSENYGVNGTEKFRDIVITGDGFIAAGVRNNKGEGGYDCYIEHLDIQLLSFYNETFGGKTNERLGSLMINDLGTHAWFAGYNIEYKIANSGNAYIGGVSTQLNSSMVSCESPRVLLVDKLVSNNNINSYLNLGLVSSIISTCTTHNLST